MTGLISTLLKLISTYDVNSVMALETLSSSYFPASEANAHLKAMAHVPPKLQTTK
jgi:hypothetical protein